MADQQTTADFLSSYPAPGGAPAVQAGSASVPRTTSDFLKDFPAPTAVQAQPSAVQQQSGPMRYINGIGSAMAKGTAATLGLPGTINQATLTGVNKLGSLFGLDPVSPAAKALLFPGSMLPSASDMIGATDKLGLTDRADLTPQNAAERYGTALATAVPSIGATILSGGAALPAVLAGTGGAVAGQGAKDLGLSPGLQLGASLVGGVGGAGTAKLLSPQNLEAVASTLGSSQTLQEAGGKLQDAARDWLANVMPAKEEAAWAPITSELTGVKTPLTNTVAALKDIVGDSEAPLAGAQKLLRPQLPDKLLAQVNPEPLQLKPGETAGNKYWEDLLAGVDKNPNFEDVKNLRTALGTAMGKPDMLRDIGEQNAAQVYKALTSDMRGAAETRGYGDLFDAANKDSVALHDIAEGPMKKLVADASPSRNDPNPGQAAKSIMSESKADGTDLATLRAEIPDAMDELAAAHLRTTGGSAWGKLAPEAQAALVPDQSTRALVSGAIPVKESLTTGLSHVGQMSVGSFLGGVAEPVLSMVNANTGLAPWQLALAGAAAPSLFRGARLLVTNPGATLPGALQGLVSNPNPLEAQRPR